MPDLVVLISAFVVSVVLTGLIRRYAIKTSLLDIPNHRSSHQLPTPRGGGVAIVAVFSVASIALVLTGTIGWSVFWAIFGGSLIVSGISYWDDHGHVSALWRFLVHIISAVWVVWWVGSIAPVNLGVITLDLGWGRAVVTVLFIVWMLNLYNFMDGIDGIAGVQAVSVAFGLAAILAFQGESGLALWLAVLGTASAGFLAWNWPPAKIFMGDVGSSFLGFVFAAFAVLSHNEGSVTLWVWLIMCSVFIADASFTLFYRVLKGHKWHQPHRTHAYQWASRYFSSHKLVTLSVLAINGLWLFPLAWYASIEPDYGFYLWLVACTPLFFLVIRFNAGRPESVPAG
ncbi:MAG TPA: glycosyltransferase family 4 protein [Candidatus Tenderia electrophaga]|uniref:Glycosyltransferase family 4 protein n=1 Tax=Candidatus Tenderia electrophaga TaxID=1748243 RepID=A0A832J7U8_9GAMM|nr:glycosyltransferase family 4 protein [Candidatus Tenderia electrophaga]